MTQDKESEKETNEITMTFGDGKTISYNAPFKSVYSPSRTASISTTAQKQDKPRNRRFGRRQRSRSISSKSFEKDSICEKTATIRQIFDDNEKEFVSDGNTKKPFFPQTADRINGHSKRRKSKDLTDLHSAKDWNKIHQQQIWAKEPPLGNYQKNKEQRQQKLLSNAQLTPGYRSRSKSMVAKRNTHNSEKKPNKKRVTIKPSINDHLYNHNGDKKLNRKVNRQPTPFKHAMSYNVKQKASRQPNLTSIPFNDSLCEEAEENDNKNKSKSNSVNSNNSSKSSSIDKIKVPKKKLAYNPDKIKSRLFESTNSSLNKIKTTVHKRGSQTPQIRSNKNKSITNRNWSAIKQRPDHLANSGLKRLPGKKPITLSSINDENRGSNINKRGIKRKLSWSQDMINNNGNMNKVQPPTLKKRRMSATPSSKPRWQ